jgi:endonuclease/exonuclease/phosphatase family metal-dependent hydrolase
VRVATWNLWWRFGDWRARRTAIRAVLEEVAPDICTLQEVWADADENMAGWLADALGLQWAWGPARDQELWQKRIGDSSVHFGVALLSRWPIVEPRYEDLPGDRGRPMLSAIVEAPHARIPVVTAHLSATALNSARRVGQVERVLRVTGERLTKEHPPIVAGDFNAVPDSEEIRLLGGSLGRQVVPGLVLLDSWAFAEPDERGFTWDRRNPYVAQAPEPSGRIDYVKVGLRYDLSVGRIRSVRLAGTGPVDGVWPSDHAAVVVELSDQS